MARKPHARLISRKTIQIAATKAADQLARLESLEDRRLLASTPFYGSPFNLPTTIQAEDFDKGGQSAAYYDETAANQGGAYRTTDRVDLEAATDTGGGYDMCYVLPGEWENYTVNVCTYKPTTQTVTRQVCTMQQVAKTIQVPVCSLQQHVENVTINVPVTTPVVQNYTVQVCEMVPTVQKRMVNVVQCVPTQRKFNVNVVTYQQVAREITVCVPVITCVPAPVVTCASPCAY